MSTVSKDEALKEDVRNYWNERPCGTQFTDLEWGSKSFFDNVERHRYETQPFMRELMEFDRFKEKKLLEIGCGLGTDLVQFARGGAHVTAVDLTPRSIELVKKRFALEGLPVDAQVADTERLPFGDGSFDAVYSFGVLHHTPNTEQALNEIYRVLQPGGRIIIMLYHKRSLHVWLGTPLHILSRKKHNGLLPVSDDWVRVYDGESNPLGKSYSKSAARKMFYRFKNLSTTLCDPIRKRYPGFLNSLNQRYLAGRMGFWMIIKGEK